MVAYRAADTYAHVTQTAATPHIIYFYRVTACTTWPSYIGASHFAARPANLPRIILALALYPIGKQTSSPAKAVQGTHQAEAYSVGSAASSFKAQRKLMGTSLSSVRGRSNCTSDLMPMSTRLTSRREM